MEGDLGAAGGVDPAPQSRPTQNTENPALVTTAGRVYAVDVGDRR
jgi:hypothetical protein